jgi:hypothetical protein
MTDEVHCSAEGCPASHGNHRWGRIKADAWFHQKDGKAWCPDHIPPWVAEWRAKQAEETP